MLDTGFTETFGLGVEQAAVGTAETIGLQGALQGLRLQQYRQPVSVRSAIGALASDESADHR